MRSRAKKLADALLQGQRFAIGEAVKVVHYLDNEFRLRLNLSVDYGIGEKFFNEVVYIESISHRNVDTFYRLSCGIIAPDRMLEAA